MVINKAIKDTLRAYEIPQTEGILCLMVIYYELPMPDILNSALGDIMRQINISHIVERDYSTETVKWNIPLYGGEDTTWDWVNSEYREIFKKIRPDRAGSPTSCLKRMKDFFKAHPEVRKEEVLKAALMYVASVDDPQYLQGADYFIIKSSNTGGMTSRLEQYLEILKARKITELTRKDKIME